MAAARVGIIGYGVLGRQLEQFIAAARGADAVQWVRFDDALAEQGEPGAVPFADHADDRFADCDFYVALGYRHLAAKAAILARLERLGRSLPSLVHPTAFIDPTATLGPGVVVFQHCTVGSGVTLSAGALLHSSVTLAHDDVVGTATYVGPGVTLSGFVAIGARSFVGAGSVIANGVTVGADATIGIGTCVTGDVAASTSVIGNPMRVLDQPLGLK